VSLERSQTRLAVRRLLACASLLVMIAPGALAQDQRPWVDPPTSLPDNPPEPAPGANPAATRERGEPQAGAPGTPRSSATRRSPRSGLARPDQAPTSPNVSSRASRLGAATGTETRAPVSRSPRASSAAPAPSAPTVRETRRDDTPPEQRSRILRAGSSPSFNCRYAGTLVEHTICADPVLALKDRQMALLYEQSGGSRHGPVDEHQWRWLTARDACVRLAPRALRACVRQVYDARIAELAGARR
jgi:hypothetical protein